VAFGAYPRRVCRRYAGRGDVRVELFGMRERADAVSVVATFPRMRRVR